MWNKFIRASNRFMRGRYGIDVLSRDLSYLLLGLIVLNIFFKSIILRYVSLLVLFYIYYRFLSKKLAKRRSENTKYMNLKYKVLSPFRKIKRNLKNYKTYKYLNCPNCKNEMRVPRGKKKIIVTCPYCKTKFDAKS